MNPLRRFSVTTIGMARLQEAAQDPRWEGVPGPGTRAAMARITGLSMSTISGILQGLPVGEHSARTLARMFGPEAVVESERIRQ